jgi:hypothetical protein
MTTGKKSVVIHLDNGLKCIIPDKLKFELDILIDDMMISQQDILFVIDGKEGSGKSRTGRVLGKYISSVTKVKFSVPNIHFNTQDYINGVIKGQKFQVNILDESREALNKLRSMSNSNVLFTNWLSENRDQQQVHILLLPRVHDIDKYISSHRMAFLLHHLKRHVKDDETRSGYRLVFGDFELYANNSDLQRAIFNSKNGHYRYPTSCKFRRKILDYEVFDRLELMNYAEKKKRKRDQKYLELFGKNKKDYLARNMVYNMRQKGHTVQHIVEITGKSKTWVYDVLVDFEKTDNEGFPKPDTY